MKKLFPKSLEQSFLTKWWTLVVGLVLLVAVGFNLLNHSPAASAQVDPLISEPHLKASAKLPVAEPAALPAAQITDPELQVSCLHSPIWPGVGEPVTFSAEAINVPQPNLLVKIDIEVTHTDGSSQSACAAIGETCTSPNPPTFTNGDISYSCEVTVFQSGSPTPIMAESGLRSSHIGPYVEAPAVPVLFTTERARAIDIVFIRDHESYPDDAGGPDGETNIAFLAGVHSIISEAYYDEDIFLMNQSNLNFWIARDTGVAQSADQCFDQGCGHQLPNNWSSESGYAFADVGIILHDKEIQNLALPSIRVFSARPATSVRTIRYETGRVPFGLADERPSPPDGGYFQAHDFPNLFENEVDCENDAQNRGIPPPDTLPLCEQITDETGNTWFRLDKAVSFEVDVMGTGEEFQAADEQRVNWLFDQCNLGNCDQPALPVE